MKERITKEKLEFIKEFLKTRPEALAVYGYGSGVIPQEGSNPNEKKEIDLIIIADNLLKWIHENLEMNPEEFTNPSKKYFLKSTLKDLEKGAPIVYLSHIPFENEYFKTGIISKDKLLSSCLERSSSFVPFRLEKPCAKIFCNDKEIENAIIYDRQITLMLCLLMLNKNENKLYDLITKICSISYLGDFRVKIKCEDPNKIRNLVNKQLDYFIEDYTSVNKNYFDISNDNITINYNSINKDYDILPKAIKSVLNEYEIKEENQYILAKKLTEYFTKESQKESLPMAIKGIHTVGLEKAFQYGLRKLKKGRTK